MTTNVPQDVIDDFEEAGFPVELMFDWDNRLAKFLELRAQRQQGAEPVAWVNPMVLRLKDCGALGGEVAFFQASDRCLPLYTTPPQANALVAAAYRDAAELIMPKEGGYVSPKLRHLTAAAGEVSKLNAEIILNSIPADAEAALREVCMKVAEAVDNAAYAPYQRLETKELESIVNSVLGEGKS
jgi:hypothetical protein